MENELEDFIQRNRENFDRKTPDPAVLGRIMAQMQPKEEQPKEKGILIPFSVIRWAAAAMILLTLGISYWVSKKQVVPIAVVKPKTTAHPKITNQDDSLKQAEATQMANAVATTHKRADSVDRELAIRKRALAAKLQSQPSNSAKQVIFAGLNDMDSPATRINATSEVYKLKNAGNDIVDALVETLNNDPSSNVRLAALDGLTRFYTNGYVKKKLIASLKKQNDPLVQIALINLLTQMRESGILTELNKIANDEHTDKAVRDCAYSGIIQLHSI